MHEEKGHEYDDFASLKDGELRLDLRRYEGRQPIVIAAGIDQPPFEGGRFVQSVEPGRRNRLTIAGNLGSGELILLVVDTAVPQQGPWVAFIQLRDHRG